GEKIGRILENDRLTGETGDADLELRRVQLRQIQRRRLPVGNHLHDFRRVKVARAAGAGDLRKKYVEARRGVAGGQRDVGRGDADARGAVARNGDLLEENLVRVQWIEIVVEIDARGRVAGRWASPLIVEPQRSALALRHGIGARAVESNQVGPGPVIG